ncbi:PREDICTED: uncharacterized protein LOC106820911 [Priapulus caudatus]|uniref:Uncharacterized protein LOC106820911 n=1 Tax=Priapulus caudatus TaxID=37621 RepID=A0ABM1F976_PRICU|nr:PREDICTED: uncharacterized protein LOC106820911 [Priapulus caudatus]
MCKAKASSAHLGRSLDNHAFLHHSNLNLPEYLALMWALMDIGRGVVACMVATKYKSTRIPYPPSVSNCETFGYGIVPLPPPGGVHEDKGWWVAAAVADHTEMFLPLLESTYISRQAPAELSFQGTRILIPAGHTIHVDWFEVWRCWRYECPYYWVMHAPPPDTFVFSAMTIPIPYETLMDEEWDEDETGHPLDHGYESPEAEE